MSLISAKEIAGFLKINKLGIAGIFTARAMMTLLRIDVVNNLYRQKKNLKSTVFLEAILNELGVKYEISAKELRKLPGEGAYITISNHPLGGVDGMLLLRIILEKTPEYKILANFLLHKIEPLQPFIIPVNPFENLKKAGSNAAGIKDAIGHLKNNKPLGIFPAGEVSTHTVNGGIEDKIWDEATIKFIKRAEVPVVPIYFHARNSRLFYFLSKINDTFRTAKLPSELLSQKKRIIRIRIGSPISVNEQKKYSTLKEYGEFLRMRTYLLGKSLCISNNLHGKSIVYEKPVEGNLPKEIAEPAHTDTIKSEIELLKTMNTSLFVTGQYEVFFCDTNPIPGILHEIGRLREITFRKIGEGTNNAIDLDHYDRYYHHLILWDNNAQKIAGAYRIGLGKEIYSKYGIKGFYLSSTFDFDDKMHELMSDSLELGRAFIVEEYQRKTMPLLLLWRGVTNVAKKFPQHKYMIGSVSISNLLSEFSKSLIIEFLKQHYLDQSKNRLIHARQEYKIRKDDMITDLVQNHLDNDLDMLDSIIAEVESGQWKVPVLIKKYIHQNARVLSFNVDPDFNNAIDVLMYIKVQEISEELNIKIIRNCK